VNVSFALSRTRDEYTAQKQEVENTKKTLTDFYDDMCQLRGKYM